MQSQIVDRLFAATGTIYVYRQNLFPPSTSPAFIYIKSTNMNRKDTYTVHFREDNYPWLGCAIPLQYRDRLSPDGTIGELLLH